MARKLGRNGDPPTTRAIDDLAIRPYRQGALDSYCGLYAIINAMFRLKPGVFLENDSNADELFYALVKAATRICSPVELCREGMDAIELEYVARAAIRHMRRHGHKFALKRPERIKLSSNGSVEEWLDKAQTVRSIAVIVYVEERDQSHWSVLAKVRGNRVSLFDSDAMHSTHLKRCEPVLVFCNTP